ncbi:MAG: hemerythrin domain-containing protein [Syntrophobacteraceae bacterium]|jgi:hemerythrin-like domain-containing protein
MKPIQDLKAEHEGILLMLDILERMSERIVAGKSVPTDHLKQVLDFLQVFVDKCHHGKEEKLLFAAMEEAGVPKEGGPSLRLGSPLHAAVSGNASSPRPIFSEGGPLAVMLSEHDRGRQFIKEMKNLLHSSEKGEPGSLEVLTTPALQYVNLLRSHIWKENNVLFPMAEKAVTADKLNLIGEQFDRFEKEEIGQGTHETFHEMIDKLSKIYL